MESRGWFITGSLIVFVLALGLAAPLARAQTGTVNSRTQDGVGNKITSTNNAGKQSLDTNVTGGTVTTTPLASTVSTGTITANCPNIDSCPANSTVTVAVTGQQSVGFYFISGSGVGGLIHADFSRNGTNWEIAEVLADLAGAKTLLTAGIDSSLAFGNNYSVVPLSGITHVRVRAVGVGGPNYPVVLVASQVTPPLVDPSVGVPGISTVGMKAQYIAGEYLGTLYPLLMRDSYVGINQVPGLPVYLVFNGNQPMLTSTSVTMATDQTKMPFYLSQTTTDNDVDANQGAPGTNSNAWFDRAMQFSSFGTPAQTTVGTTAVTLLAAIDNCKLVSVQNTGTTVIKLSIGTTDPTQTVYHYALKAGAAADDGLGATLISDQVDADVRAISSAAGGTVVESCAP